MRRLTCLFCLLTACAVEAPDARSSTASTEVVVDEMCSTIDYGPHRPADQLFDFMTAERADAFMHRFESLGLVQALGGPDARYTGLSSDPRILGLVAEVFRGMKQVFPVETADLNDPPPVAIIETPVRNAFAIPPGLVDGGAKAPWLFAVHTGILQDPDDSIAGVIAHEMGHLILRNYAPDVRERIVSTYLLPSLDERAIFGAKQPNDPTVQQHLMSLVPLESKIGFSPEQGLNGGTSPYTGLLRGLIANDPSPACTDATTALDALRDAQAPFRPRYNEVGAQPRVPNDAELIELRRASDAALASVKPCLAASSNVRTLMQLYLESGVPAEALSEAMFPQEAEADADATLTTLGLRALAAESKMRADATTLRADPAFPLARLRSYDTEQDSDDTAVRVLLALGREPTSNAQFLLDTMTPEARADCLAAVAANLPIDFGQFRDPHPANCWRYFHAVELAKSLRQCPATPPGRRAPSSTGNAPGTIPALDPVDLIRRPQ